MDGRKHWSYEKVFTIQNKLEFGVRTKSRWKGKDVEQGFLANKITSFFESKGFTKKKEESSEKDNVQVLTFSLAGQGRPVIAYVIIRGTPADFEIEFAVDRKAETMARLGVLSTYFGGGIYMRGRLENSALVERLEGDFWDYINQEIVRRNDDAKA